MAKEIGRFDPDLEMFIEAKKEPSIRHLTFLRQLAEKGKFGHYPLSVPKGEQVFKMPDAEVRRYAMIQGNQELKPQPPTESQGGINDHVAKTGDY